jgi:hypothetical protein
MNEKMNKGSALCDGFITESYFDLIIQQFVSIILSLESVPVQRVCASHSVLNLIFTQTELTYIIKLLLQENLGRYRCCYNRKEC